MVSVNEPSGPRAYMALTRIACSSCPEVCGLRPGHPEDTFWIVADLARRGLSIQVCSSNLSQITKPKLMANAHRFCPRASRVVRCSGSEVTATVGQSNFAPSPLGMTMLRVSLAGNMDTETGRLESSPTVQYCTEVFL